MKNRIILSLSALMVLVSILFAFSGCSSASSFFSEKADFSAVIGNIAKRIFPDCGKDMNAFKASDIISKGENEQALDLVFEGRINNGGKSSELSLQGNYDNNNLNVGLLSTKEDSFITLNDVLDKPVKIPFSTIFDEKYFSSKDLAYINELISAADNAVKKTLLKQEIESEKVTYKVNDVEQLAVKKTTRISKDVALTFLKDIQSECEQIFTSDFFKTLFQNSISDSSIFRGSYSDVIKALETTDFNIIWSKSILLGSVIEEHIVLDLGATDEKIEFKFENKKALEYEKGLISIVYSAGELDTVLLNIDYENRNSKLNGNISINGVLQTSIDSTESEKDGEKSSETVLNVKLASTGNEYEISLSVGLNSITDKQNLYDINLNITKPQIAYSFKLTTLENTKKIENTLSDCYTLSNDSDGIDLYNKIRQAALEKYPSLTNVFPDISADNNYSMNEIIATMDAKDISASPYLYNLQMYYDYYKNQIEMYSSKEGSFVDLLKTKDMGGKILDVYITDKAKEDFLYSYCVDKKFDELGLKLTLKDYLSAANNLQKAGYSDEVFSTLENTYSLTKANVRYLLLTYAKQDALIEYYFGDNGTVKISEEDIKAKYNEDYAGIKYGVSYKYKNDTQNPEKFDDETLAEKSKATQSVLTQLQTGAISMNDAIKQFSEDYYSEEKKEVYGPDSYDEIDKINETMLKGYIVDKTGLSGDVSFPKEVADSLFKLNEGEYSFVSDADVAFLFIQRINSDFGYNERYKTIKESLIKEKSEEMKAQWIAELNCVFKEETLVKYNVNNLKSLFLNQ